MPKAKRPSLAALTPPTGIEAGLQRQFALRQQGEQRAQRMAQQHDTALAGDPMARFGRNALSGDIGGLSHEWGPFFEQLQQSGVNIGATRGTPDAAPGLRDSPVTGTVPLSLQALADTTYKYDGKRPVALRGKR